MHMRAGRPSAKRMNGVTILKMILTTHEDHLNQKKMAYIPTVIQKRKFMTKKGIKANFITKLIFTGGSAIFIASKEVIKEPSFKSR